MVAAEKKSLDSICASASLPASESSSDEGRGIHVAQDSDSFQRFARRYDSLAALWSSKNSYAIINEKR